MFDKIQAWLRARFVRMHGEGEPHQADLYRCYTCGRLLTWHFIHSGQFCCNAKMVPTNPTIWETIKLLLIRTPHADHV